MSLPLAPDSFKARQDSARTLRLAALLPVSDLKAHLPLPQQVGIIGKLHTQKGCTFALEELRRLQDDARFANLSFAVAGVGESRCVRGFKDLAATEPRRFAFLGRLERRDMYACVRSLDLVLNPTLYHQGLDTTMLEALVAGTPILASDVGSIRATLLDDPRFGDTFRMGDGDDLQAKLLGAADARLKATHGPAITAANSARFSEAGMLERYEKALRRIAARGRGGSAGDGGGGGGAAGGSSGAIDQHGGGREGDGGSMQPLGSGETQPLGGSA
jgi:glycosyltransferase involved in cell wall biosynthesis